MTVTKNWWLVAEKWSLMILAFSLSWSISAMNIMLVVCVLLAIHRVVVDADVREIFLKGITIPLIVFFSLEFIMMLLSGFQIKFHSYFEDKWVLTAYFTTLILIRDKSRFKSVFMAFLAGGIAVSILAGMQFFFGWDVLSHKDFVPIQDNRYVTCGAFNNHLTFGGTTLIMFMFAVGIFLHKVGKKNQLICIGIMFLTGFALMVSYARSALVGLSAGVMVIFFALSQKWKYWFLLGSLLVAVAAFLFVPGLFGRFKYAVKIDPRIEVTRINLWATSLVIIQHHPLFGIGQNNFDTGFEMYHVPGFYSNHSHPHNDFLSVGVDSGVIALGVFLLLWYIFFRIYRQSWMMLRSQPGIEKWMLVSAMATAASILLGGMFQNYQSDAEVGTMLWFTIGMTHWIIIQAQEKLPSGR